MKLLAVDDDPVILDLLPVVFREADLPNMDLASSAEAALEVLSDQNNHYDCLLFDIQMAQMDGVELCRKVRELGHHRHSPILMLTSIKDHHQIERAFAAGANDYITKPFDVKEIATRVRVAQRMIKQAGPITWLDPLDVEEPTQAGRHSFDISDPLRISGSSNLILPFSLGNYLSQLSRQRLDNCTIFATKIEEIGNLYANCKSHEYAAALTEIISAMNTVVASSSLLMSYEGDGTLMSITQDSSSLEWPDIEEHLKEVLTSEACVYDDGTPMPLGLSVGNPIAPNASRTQRVKKTFDRATDRALMREKTKIKNAPRGPASKFLDPRSYHFS